MTCMVARQHERQTDYYERANHDFTIQNMTQRLRLLDDPWKATKPAIPQPFSLTRETT